MCFFLEGRLEKDERMVSRSPQVARIQICKVNISRLLRDKLVYFINKIRGEVLCLLKTCVTIPFISLDPTYLDFHLPSILIDLQLSMKGRSR